ncbi:hypothetical protein lerEdw1_003985 [Lerista edwardsae]|nr:hypothetical protein lerEdw1_003985 [Lerista edwardsae]
MSKPVTPSTYVCRLGYGMMRQLADLIDPQEGWKKLAIDIKDPSGANRYSQMHIRRFEALKQVGKSPTCELLHDWGTLNCTVSDLVELLIRNQFLAPASILLPGLPHFLFHELQSITNNFDDRTVSTGGNKLGEGGFGVVYKGCINGRTVAVKRLAAVTDVSIQDLKKQLEQEVKLMATCQHENLIELLGFSSDCDQPCLVYDYMPNGSLLDRLACLDDTAPIPWETRCSIVQGAANGICYLHENNHIHRDIKSANILLTGDFVPKLSDFGLTRASVRLTHTIVTERIVGTAAYMAPEALRGEITPKSDVFSFGVVLLEIITGLTPVDENRDPQLLVFFLQNCLIIIFVCLSIKEEIEDEEKTIEEYVDGKMSDWSIPSVEQLYSVACQCLNERKNRRPDIQTVPGFLML